MDLSITIADYSNEQHANDIATLLNEYALDPMGGGAALNEDVKTRLASALAGVPHAFSILCYVDGRPAGLANCFQGFSTFNCRPLMNIHDLVVRSEYRGQGISQRLLEKIEEEARQRDCCKITLEVLEGNEVAQNAYLKSGFTAYQLDPTQGKALFWQKPV